MTIKVGDKVEITTGIRNQRNRPGTITATDGYHVWVELESPVELVMTTGCVILGAEVRVPIGQIRKVG